MISYDRINNLKEDRQAVVSGFVTDALRPDLQRMMLNYDRYGESELIINKLGELGVVINASFKVQDFGAGVGDHGIVFLRRGASVIFVDTKQSSINFINYRCAREGLTPSDQGSFVPNLIICSKILEWLPDPFTKIKAVIASTVKYIYTSAYPVVGVDGIASTIPQAQTNAAAALNVLRNNFAEINLGSKRRLWIR